eukprot:392768-Prymnesium_polylepis.1
MYETGRLVGSILPQVVGASMARSEGGGGGGSALERQRRTSSNRSGFRKSACASTMRMRHPPEYSRVGLACMSVSNPRPDSSCTPTHARRVTRDVWCATCDVERSERPARRNASTAQRQRGATSARRNGSAGTRLPSRRERVGG